VAITGQRRALLWWGQASSGDDGGVVFPSITISSSATAAFASSPYRGQPEVGAPRPPQRSLRPLLSGAAPNSSSPFSTPRFALHRRPSHPSPRLLLLLAARAALLERAAGARAPDAPSPFLGLREDSEKIKGLFAKRSLLARSRPSMRPNRQSGLPSDVDALPGLGIGQEL
jgi:hypothetical protein